MIAVAVVAAAALLLYSFLTRSSDPERAERVGSRFDSVIAGEDSPAVRSLLKVAKPLAGAAVSNPPEESPTYRTLRLRLAAAGNPYGGSVEVFLALQVAVTLIGSAILAVVILTHPGGALALMGVGGGLAVMAWPYSKVWELGKKRTAEVNAALPEFAELLMMPLNSGYGIVAALEFTAERLDGPVSREVLHLTDAIRSRSVSEAVAFTEAGEHLGTPAARSFFAVLAQAFLEGSKVVETLNGQAVQLRKTEHERLRERISKMENTIAVMTGIHLLPGIFLIVLFPALVTMSGI